MNISKLSIGIKQFFARCSNVRPVVWIGLYVALVPVFAFIYWLLPDNQFRIPDGSGTDFGSWLYYSIVTITTLGFGDYTPAHAGAQAVTAIEVMCGLIFLGFFLNAVGSLKSEIAVESELEKQKKLHFATEKDKLIKHIPVIMHQLNTFLALCYAVTTPVSKRSNSKSVYNPDFTFHDLADLFKPSQLPSDHTMLPAAAVLLKCADRTSLMLDSLQTKIDLTLWPSLLEDCFAFVAKWQLFSSTDALSEWAAEVNRENHDNPTSIRELALQKAISASDGLPKGSEQQLLSPIVELYYFIKEGASLSINIESLLSTIATQKEE